MKEGILGLGEVCLDWVAVVDHFPEPDEKVDSIEQNLFGGGVTANYITAASRLGAKTKFFGAIGSDQYGEFLKKDLEKEGVDISYLETIKDAPTPVNFIIVSKESGEKMIIQSPYMHTTVPTENSFKEEVLNDIALIHSTAIYPDLTKTAFTMARKKGIVTSLDLEKQIAIWGKEKLLPIIDLVDILLPNKEGAMQLTGKKNPIEAAKTFINWGVKLVVITMGHEGAIALTKNEKVSAPAFNVPVVDTTGAGDTFCAAFGFAYVIKKFSLADALLFANAAAALKIQKLGARTGMPTYPQVKEFLNSRSYNFL